MKSHNLLTNMETILQSEIVKKKTAQKQETCQGICQQYKGHYKIITETLLTIIIIIAKIDFTSGIEPLQKTCLLVTARILRKVLDYQQ